MLTEVQLKNTPLAEDHKKLNARMVPFGGWEMPVQYESILAEYKQTREAAAIFDISHMGEFVIEGDCVETGLDRLVTMSIKDMPVGTSKYGCLCNEDGGVIDDLIVFRLETEKWFLVVNGATTEKDAQHFKKYLKEGTPFDDQSLKIGKIDVQGPDSREVLKALVPDIESLEYFKFDHFELLGNNVLISRTGYTGELGYEIFFPWDQTSALWQKLLEDPRVKPAGLGARDMLRLEVGYSLYGHELSDQWTPLESGLSRFVDFEKDFIGKDAIVAQKEEGVPQKIIGFLSHTRRSPREDHIIYNEQHEEIGKVTSGSFSPCLNKGIGLGFVRSELAKKGTAIYYGNENNYNEATIESRIFFKEGSLKN